MIFRVWTFIPALFLLLFFVAASGSNAQTGSAAEVAKATTTTTKAAQPGTPATPAFSEYRNIRIGMPVDDVRRSLEQYVRAKGDRQDVLVFSDAESAQVFYDAGKVTAVSVDYLVKKGAAPTAMEVLGFEVQPKPDGSLYALKRYPEAGYWVSYNRTSGESPIVTVTMQALQ